MCGVGRSGFSSADRLVIADLLWDHELLHGHPVHGWEVLSHNIRAVGVVRGAEVLHQVQGVLSNLDGVLHVLFNPLQSLDTLLTCELFLLPGITDTHSLADMDSTINKVVHYFSSHIMNHHSKPMHFLCALRAGEPRLW